MFSSSLSLAFKDSLAILQFISIILITFLYLTLLTILAEMLSWLLTGERWLGSVLAPKIFWNKVSRTNQNWMISASQPSVLKNWTYSEEYRDDIVGSGQEVTVENCLQSIAKRHCLLKPKLLRNPITISHLNSSWSSSDSRFQLHESSISSQSNHLTQK